MSVLRGRWRDKGDEGFSVIELVVTMGIFTTVLVVFLAAVVSMSQTTARAQATSDSASDIRTVFQRLDKEVRYASEINAPGTAGGDVYVEYLVPATVATSEELCVQWRLETDAMELQRRTWPPADPDAVTGWATMVTNLRNDLTDPAQAPFIRHSAGTTADGKVYTKQRLDVYLDAGMGEAREGGGSQLDVTFVALNTSVNSETNASADRVCLAGGVQRP
ncbi:hypothetical protein [Demequina sp. NBRC 110053]|uniref:hypothetical protein n=1 Tax=Demequina sp. NBRC 110053 TaxID=1570342 RepID=UPI0009FEF7DD|nr:hypothetical protein [Demequina sp. NBRC 110053]